MLLKHLAYGIATFIPGVNELGLKGTKGTDSARYCYSVWLRHLVMAKRNQLNSDPKIVAELGPGDSLGIGLAALISGCDQYFAFDVVEYANITKNAQIFDELVKLFQERAPIPGEAEFPNVKPFLDNYDFPADILDENRLQQALEPSRINHIRAAIENCQQADSMIQYKAPWYDDSVRDQEFVDMIYSQAVLEHVDDLNGTYKAMYAWLRPNGYISHEIDFKCHGTANEWNGHWAHSDFMWKLMRGKQAYLINREPHSTHITKLNAAGFEIICDDKTQLKSSLGQERLAPKFKSISSDDLVTSDAFIQGVKKTSLV
jgi:Methyltransferase domain